MGKDAGAADERRSGFYYGWWVLFAGAVTEMLAIGSTSYAAGLFVLPLQQELSLTRAEANSSVPILFTGAAIVATWVGSLFDRYPIERIMGIGAVGLGAGFIVIAATSSIWVMAFMLFVPMAFGFMAIGPISTTTLVTRWFYRRRGRALGIATVATSGGGIVVIPLLSWAIQSFGWRAALAIEGVLMPAIVLALTFFVIRSRPSDRDLLGHDEQDGRPAADVIQRPPDSGSRHPQNWTIREILTSLNFWVVALTLSAITSINQALVVTIVPYGTGLGFTPAPLAFLISAFAVSAAMVKVGSGWLAEFVDRRMIMLASTIAMTLALFVLIFFSTYSMLLTACCLAGMALGCILPSTAALIAEYFGTPSYGTATGAVYVTIGIASIMSVRFAGAVFDSTGDYHAAFLVFALISAASAIAALFAPQPARGAYAAK